MKRFIPTLFILICLQLFASNVIGQVMPTKYAFFELFTNTPCVICGSQNPGFFERLENYPDQYHLVSFYPGNPYSNCIFYQANKDENKDRLNFYSGQIFGSPTVIMNGLESNNPNGVTNTVLQNLTGGESWLQIAVHEEGDMNRSVSIQLDDFSNAGNTNPVLFAVIVEREIMYNAPNGETVHHNVFREFLTPTDGVEIDLSTNSAVVNFDYDVNENWAADQSYVVAWAMESSTKAIINSGTRFDDLISTSTKNFSLLENISVFPNPTSDDVKITSEEYLPASNILISDIHGRLMLQFQAVLGPNVFRIDATNLMSGFYQLEIQNEARIFNSMIQIVR